jgi:hypothetical protein
VSSGQSSSFLKARTSPHTGVPLTTRDESSFSYAIIRHNVRTYESGGVVQVVRGKNSAETTVKQYEDSQSSEDRHAGWRYFPEKTEIKPGTSAVDATHRRQSDLESRERKAQEDIDAAAPAPKSH